MIIYVHAISLKPVFGKEICRFRRSPRSDRKCVTVVVAVVVAVGVDFVAVFSPGASTQPIWV